MAVKSARNTVACESKRRFPFFVSPTEKRASMEASLGCLLHDVTISQPITTGYCIQTANTRESCVLPTLFVWKRVCFKCEVEHCCQRKTSLTPPSPPPFFFSSSVIVLIWKCVCVVLFWFFCFIFRKLYWHGESFCFLFTGPVGQTGKLFIWSLLLRTFECCKIR